MKVLKPRLSRKLLVLCFSIFVLVAFMSAGLFYRSTPQHQDPTIRGEQLDSSKKARSVPEKQYPIEAVFPSQQQGKSQADQASQDFLADWIPPEQPAADLIGPEAQPDSGGEELVYFGEKYSEPFDTKKMEELLSIGKHVVP